MGFLWHEGEGDDGDYCDDCDSNDGDEGDGDNDHDDGDWQVFIRNFGFTKEMQSP